MDALDMYNFLPEGEINRMIGTATVLVRATLDFENEVRELVYAAITDMMAAGIKGDPDTIENESMCDRLIQQCIMLYVKANFGYQEPAIYDRLNASYENLKARLAMTTGYTEFGGTDG